jgi:hypothetical protein
MNKMHCVAGIACVLNQYAYDPKGLIMTVHKDSESQNGKVLENRGIVGALQ